MMLLMHGVAVRLLVLVTMLVVGRYVVLVLVLIVWGCM